MNDMRKLIEAVESAQSDNASSALVRKIGTHMSEILEEFYSYYDLESEDPDIGNNFENHGDTNDYTREQFAWLQAYSAFIGASERLFDKLIDIKF